MLLLASLAACASANKKPDVPYPAYVVTDDLPDLFLAALPGVRAKEFTSDMRTRASSNRVDLPPDWSGTTGGAPGKSLEIFVLDGTLSFSDFELGAGGYAYVPPGSLGFRLETEGGAQILYALDDIDDSSVIRAPIILDSGLVPWTEISSGRYEKELRKDPGSGTRTWLERIDPGVPVPLSSSSAAREGYLVLGQYLHAECVDGIAEAGEYLPGGYFRRPEGAINGGPGSMAIVSSVWFLRERSEGEVKEEAVCPPKYEAPDED